MCFGFIVPYDLFIYLSRIECHCHLSPIALSVLQFIFSVCWTIHGGSGVAKCIYMNQKYIFIESTPSSVAIKEKKNFFLHKISKNKIQIVAYCAAHCYSRRDTQHIQQTNAMANNCQQRSPDVTAQRCNFTQFDESQMAELSTRNE